MFGCVRLLFSTTNKRILIEKLIKIKLILHQTLQIFRQENGKEILDF